MKVLRPLLDEEDTNSGGRYAVSSEIVRRRFDWFLKGEAAERALSEGGTGKEGIISMAVEAHGLEEVLGNGEQTAVEGETAFSARVEVCGSESCTVYWEGEGDAILQVMTITPPHDGGVSRHNRPGNLAPPEFLSGSSGLLPQTPVTPTTLSSKQWGTPRGDAGFHPLAGERKSRYSVGTWRDATIQEGKRRSRIGWTQTIIGLDPGAMIV